MYVLLTGLVLMSSMPARNPHPEGYSSLSPYLMVRKVEAQVEFLQRVFGASILEELRSPGGILWHADVRVGNTVVMLGRAQRAYPARVNSVYVWCDDADAVYRDALAQGATSVEVPADQFYGTREAGFRDPQGNIWWVGQQIETLTHEEKEQRIGDGPPDE